MKVTASAPEKKKKAKVSAETAAPAPIVHVPLKLIVTSPQLRYRDIDPAHVEELKVSILEKGLDTPLSVWNGGEEGLTVKFKGSDEEHPANFLVVGQHRREALKEIRSEQPDKFKELFPNGIPCQYRTYSLLDAVAEQVRENVARKNPEAAELLPQMKQLKEGGMKNAQIARAIGKSKAYVTDIFDVTTELGEEGEAAITGKGGGKKVGVSAVVKAAKQVKKDKAAGKTPDVKGAIKKASEASASGTRAAKGPGLKAVYQQLLALPAMALGIELKLWKSAFAYLVDPSENKLPKELVPDEKPKADAAKPAKKSDKGDAKKGDKKAAAAPAKEAAPAKKKSKK